MTGKSKYVIIFICIPFVLRLICVPSDEWLILNIYKGLFGMPYKSLPLTITTTSKYCRIDNAIFVNQDELNNNNKWQILFNDIWYPCDNYLLDSALERDTTGFYIFKSQCYQNKFGHIFINNASNNAPETFLRGIYKHNSLTCPYSYYKSKTNIHFLPLHIRLYLLSASLRDFILTTISKPTLDVSYLYTNVGKICYENPYIYIPSSVTNYGYLFSGNVLKYFDDSSTQSFSENIDAILAYLPDNITSNTKVIARDTNGVLVKMTSKKRLILKMNLQRLKNASNEYFLYVTLFDGVNVTTIEDEKYELYDPIILENLESMLSDLL